MFPILFTIGGFKVYASVFFLVLALLVGLVVGGRESRRLGVPNREFLLFAVSVVPIVLGLAVLNGLVFEITLWNILPDYEYSGSGGLVSFGAVLGALAWGAVLTRVFKQPITERLDLIAVILPLILGIYRIGCFLNGCCFGKEIQGLLAVYLFGQNGDGVHRYPTQIMLMLMNLAVFAWLWQRRMKKSFHGELTLSFLVLYSLGRLIIDAFRALPNMLGPLSLHQLSALAIFMITIGFFIHLRRTELLQEN
ncbi:MAG TPA: prolipoprotein diacylglyceryl transferase [Anaerolineae bacterium]|nr:prolipoprotein diacylglyceryl transferase [Anaerolineae bacterium]